MFADRYTKEPTKRTPWVVLEPGRMIIIGRSIPDNPGLFYSPVLEWVSKHVRTSEARLNIELGFEYINTASTKWLYLMLRELAETKDTGSNLNIIWYYEEGDDDMNELGYIIRSLIDCPFEIIEVEELSPAGYRENLVPVI